MNATVTTDLVFKAAGPMPLERILRSYLAAARYEFLQTLRAPAFSFPFLLMPAVLYLLFGVLIAGQSTDPVATANPQIATYLMSGFMAFGVMGPGIFGFGVGLAMERDQGLLKLKRAQPGPAGAHLFARW
jgi:ABC-2 type transport system permease protein